MLLLLRVPTCRAPESQLVRWHLAWDYWTEGIAYNANVTPVRIKLWHSEVLDAPVSEWTQVADCAPDAVDVVIFIPPAPVGFFRIGYTIL